MKLFGILAVFAQGEEETCFHPKLAQFDRVIRGKYKRKFEFEVKKIKVLHNILKNPLQLIAKTLIDRLMNHLFFFL